jgi:NADPH:quinone reductase-like Zn-dependent oxidoreductase
VKAAQRDRYGPPEIVSVVDVPTPTPADDQVLVRVHAASVNRADLDVLYPRWQFIRLATGLRRPRQPGLGLDVAGVVESVSPNAARFKPGDRVFADLFNYGSGALAEYVCASEKAFLPMPDDLSFEDAATIPHAGVLAVQSLGVTRDRSIKPGMSVMIVGASGNVGPFAIQIAKAYDTHVTAVASGEKEEFVRSLGADDFIDYRTSDYTRTGKRFDWIVDVDAHHNVLRWRNSLKSRGVYAALGGSGSWILTALFQGVAARVATDKTMGLMLGWKPFHQPDVQALEKLIAAGKVKPAIDRRFSLDQAVDALRWLDDGKARGKVLVIP